jgi:hypothetical protein
MLISIAKSTAAVLILGSALVVGTPDASAQMSADDNFNAALDQCQNVMQGQRSFCMINATNQHQAAKAMEEKKDTVVHYDYDASNDTPTQTQAKANFEQAANRCSNLQRGQRSLCMIDAHNKFQQEMGW